MDGFTVYAIYDFNATQSNECGFFAHDILSVYDKSSEWWFAKNNRTGVRGIIPYNYVENDENFSDVLDAWQDIDRVEAERKLLIPGVEPGTYILRPHVDPENPYSLSVRTQEMNVKHFRVYFNDATRKYSLSPKNQFISLKEMFTHYKYNTIDGQVILVKPRPPHVFVPPNLDDCVIRFNDLTIEQEVGKGNFGAVFQGRLQRVKVAVKKSLSDPSDDNLLEEIKVMHKLYHPRLVRFLGFCCDAPDGRLLIITEFMEKGALKDYLKTDEGKALEYPQLLRIVDQVVKAMSYLEGVQVVHRDLRAANVLVAGDGTVKVADFGLTTIYDFTMNEDQETKFPVRWTAPEAMRGGYTPSIKADVWSFGVFVFEVLTHGELPYSGSTIAEVKRLVNSGHTLPNPQQLNYACESGVYDMMKLCWNLDPEQRPTFKKLSLMIQDFIIDKNGRYTDNWDAPKD
ncbi:unnamed protein product [Mesocestoides corti]|nr:unnamed protein product [Mesocestoides corti]